MPELIAKAALAGRKPLTIAGTTLSEVDPGVVTSIAPFPGQAKALAKVLKPLGLSFPEVNSFATKGTANLIWTSRDQAFLTGVACPDMAGAAAVTDQTGGWVTLALEGPEAAAALMRYVPMDLSLAAFPVGMAVRTPFYHMAMVLMRVSDQGFQLMLFRSMARTGWHEIEVALRTLAARAA